MLKPFQISLSPTLEHHNTHFGSQLQIVSMKLKATQLLELMQLHATHASKHNLHNLHNLQHN